MRRYAGPFTNEIYSKSKMLQALECLVQSSWRNGVRAVANYRPYTKCGLRSATGDIYFFCSPSSIFLVCHDRLVLITTQTREGSRQIQLEIKHCFCAQSINESAAIEDSVPAQSANGLILKIVNYLGFRELLTAPLVLALVLTRERKTNILSSTLIKITGLFALIIHGEGF